VSNLSGKRALVCGSTQGIGRATAQRLAEAGAAVTLLARNEASLKATAAEITPVAGGDVDWLVADHEDPGAVREAAARGLERHGTYQILINNTGGPMGGMVFDAPPEQFERAFRMHVVCNHLLTQTLVPGMKASGYGRIINITSTSVREPIAGLGVSNTIRAAVAGWAKTLSKELAPAGITINNILPGYTATARLESLINTKAERANLTPGQIEHQMKSTVPMGRFADPREIAAAVLFLASPEASYITGVSLPVDGGRMMSI